MNLTIKNVSHDLMGDGYEYLINKLTDNSGHTAAELTPNLPKMMVILFLLCISSSALLFSQTNRKIRVACVGNSVTYGAGIETGTYIHTRLNYRNYWATRMRLEISAEMEPPYSPGGTGPIFSRKNSKKPWNFNPTWL